MRLDKSEEMDFSYVHDEIYNLKDVPRKFDEELYLKLNVSKTVIDYWKTIKYKPSYYYLFWLFREVSGYFNFEEYRALRDSLIPGVCKENEKIGKDLELYAVNENEAYDNYIRNDGNYMYFLSEEYLIHIFLSHIPLNRGI